MKRYTGKDFQSRQHLKQYAADTYSIDLSARFNMDNMLEALHAELDKMHASGQVCSHYQAVLPPSDCCQDDEPAPAPPAEPEAAVIVTSTPSEKAPSWFKYYLKHRKGA